MTEAVRADARRNRSRVLAAAVEAFASEGIAAPLDEIAKRAGVGAGTVYRHFQTKEALFEAVVLDRMEELSELLRQAAASGDPGIAFFDVLPRVIGQAVNNKALCDAIGLRSGSMESEACHRRFRRNLGELLRCAQAAGAVRNDLDPADLHAILAGCVAAETFHRGTRGSGRPLSGLFVDSLRATAAASVTKQGNESHRNETSASSAPSCAICGLPVTAARTGRPPRYCSPACRQKAHRQRHRPS